VTCSRVKGFRPDEDFAALHPAGVLGRKLLLRVRDVSSLRSAAPHPDRPMRECVLLLAGKRGTVVIANGKR